jgi:hypothetical protein
MEKYMSLEAYISITGRALVVTWTQIDSKLFDF